MRAGLRGVPQAARTVAEMLHAAEGPIAEGDVRPDAPVMLVGAEAGLDFRQAPVLAD